MFHAAKKLRKCHAYVLVQNTCKRRSSPAEALLEGAFGPGSPPDVVSVPGRVVIIGDHIDYHNLPVLAMAIQRKISIACRARGDRQLRAISAGEYGCRHFLLEPDLPPGPAGDWANYLKAAANSTQKRWKVTRGIDMAVTSDLPPAAGLSSSSALVAGSMIALLRANEIYPTIDELMEILPEAEQFVGTRGGGMDHAVVLASRPGCGLLVGFSPLELSSIPIPPGWSFIVAHSLTKAEKSGAARLEYNARRTAGVRAIEKLGLGSYRCALAAPLRDSAGRGLSDEEFRAFRHVVGEGSAVQKAIAALCNNDATLFGQLLLASHASLRDQLRVSCPALDQIVEIAVDAGALGARVTGAGFGGCAIVFCKAVDREQVCERLTERYYSKFNDFDRQNHLIIAEPSAGAMVD